MSSLIDRFEGTWKAAKRPEWIFKFSPWAEKIRQKDPNERQLNPQILGKSSKMPPSFNNHEIMFLRWTNLSLVLN